MIRIAVAATPSGDLLLARRVDDSAEMMIMDRRAEELRLGQAEGRIVLAERHIANQQLLIDRLRAKGQDTETAEEMLRGFEHNLKTLHEHRQVIVKTIEQIDNGACLTPFGSVSNPG
jgi:hypothetical protein